jgi:hypothetical protein
MALRVLWSRLRGAFRHDRQEADLRDEIEAHLSLLAEEKIRRGASPCEADLSALRDFGGVARVTETYRDQRGLPFLETFVQDARFAFRGLRKNPAFAATATLTLALGIGANTAIFSLIDALMLQQLPVARPHELIKLRSADTARTTIFPMPRFNSSAKAARGSPTFLQQAFPAASGRL